MVQKSLETAVQKLLVKYPMLCGKIYIDKDDRLCLEEDNFAPKLETFLKVQEATVAVPSSSGVEQLYTFLEKNVVSLLDGPKPVSHHLEHPETSTLFRVDLVLLPDDHYVLSMCIAHAMSDAASFYYLLDELHWHMSNSETGGQEEDAATRPPPLEWGHEVAATHNMRATEDLHVAAGPPFYQGVGIIAAERAETGLHSKLLLLDVVNKVEPMKKELLDHDRNEFLSTNDILTAAICQAKVDSTLLVYPENKRGSDKSLKNQAALLVGLEYAHIDVARDPNRFRSEGRL